jgi:hypothetical protein
MIFFSRFRRFCELISLSFWFENSFQEYFRSFSLFLRSIFIQSNEVLRSNNNIRWMSAFDHISTINFRIFDSRVSLILFLDQSSSRLRFFLTKLQMLHELLSLWLMLARFEDDFGILLKDFLLTSKIFLIHFMIENRLSFKHKWQIYRSQRIQKIVCASIVLHIKQIQSFRLRINLFSIQQSLIHLLIFKCFLQIFVFANHLEFSNSICESETFLQRW